HALLVARWKKLAQFNLPAGLYKLVDLFSAGEDLVRPILESGDRLSRHGLLLGRLYREVPLTLDPKQYLYQSRLDSNPPALTVGTKDTTFDHHKAIAIGKLFGLALLNHPDVVALGKAQKDLRAIWGLSATTTGRRYGLTTGLALGAFPDQPPLYTQLVNGLSSTDHNWQFATGSVDDFARVLYWLSARHDQDGLTEAVKRVLKYRRQHPGVSLDNFASALVKTHGNLPDYRAGLVLRQAIRTDEITFLKQTLKERSPSLIDGLNAIVEVSALDEHFSNYSKDGYPILEINKNIQLSLTPDYLRYAGTEYVVLFDGIRDFLATPLGKDYLKKITDASKSTGPAEGL
ncbi:hypothetical protein, partial [Endozoicomonas sp. ONNA1]|uniref:hypothetical protein n=1 Tax=Endozoicomonas sp. ONNA1 TaxID=2828740 RepID=UPI00214921DA